MNKQHGFIIIALFTLLLVACGSADDRVAATTGGGSDGNATSNDASVETRVAATVAAVLNENSSTGAVPETESTIPAIYGDATPLTPIPEMEIDAYIEASPQVEYTESSQDTRVEMNVVTGPAGQAPAPEPTATPEAMANDSASERNLLYTYRSNSRYGIALLEANLVDAVADYYGERDLVEEGYRFLVANLHVVNASDWPVPGGSFREVADNYLKRPIHGLGGGLLILDRDDDLFFCEMDPRTIISEDAYNLPGYAWPFGIVCRIPVTAAAEGINGLRIEIIEIYDGSSDYLGQNMEIDLGTFAPAVQDYSELEVELPTYTLPVSLGDICGPEIDASQIRVIDTVTWFDYPTEDPEPYMLEAVQQSRPDDPAGATVDFLNTWAQSWNRAWADEDFDTYDLVSIRTSHSNQGKTDVHANSIRRTLYLLDPDRPGAAYSVSGEEQTRRLAIVNLPIIYNNSRIPPGSQHYDSLYIVVPETDQEVSLLYLTTCSSTDKWVKFQFPRTGYVQSDDTPQSNDGSNEVTTQENVEPPIVTVDSTQSRTVTAIELKEGQFVLLEHVSGQWRPGPASVWPLVGPEGDDRIPEKESFPKPDSPLMALVFGIEGDEQIFQFDGESNITPFVAPASGFLWFGPNDDGFDDNGGELLIRVIHE